MKWLWAIPVLLCLRALIGIKIEHCVRRRASDPPEVRDGAKHWSVIIWCPLIHYRASVFTADRQDRDRG